MSTEMIERNVTIGDLTIIDTGKTEAPAGAGKPGMAGERLGALVALVVIFILSILTITEGASLADKGRLVLRTK
jgi:hypothetical protein